VRWIGLIIGMAVSAALVAQEIPKKKKKPAAKEQSAKQVRGKPTPEQIRKFNELQKTK
jgi:hypothetical protein